MQVLIKDLIEDRRLGPKRVWRRICSFDFKVRKIFKKNTYIINIVFLTFRDAFSFRCSHYFVSFFSQTTLLMSGYSRLGHNEEVVMTRPIQIEVSLIIKNLRYSFEFSQVGTIRSDFFGFLNQILAQIPILFHRQQVVLLCRASIRRSLDWKTHCILWRHASYGNLYRVRDLTKALSVFGQLLTQTTAN